ncbi:(2Fe-2S)-binding protein [Sphingomonas sp. PAMC 26617]|uniref:(2Fe-2S)-binding protein n=1 Tax=Sphingomonas sp. PAMC 26617 TaxID=1112216 RepID=UPI0002893299|nr:(2Fe-2S)-binding protein [Sphingomonas sp. PAMC 26617]
MFRKLNAKNFGRGSVIIVIDGKPIVADEGEAVAAVLLRTSPFTSRTTPVSGALRAPFCMMGACFDCLVEIDGHSSKRSCMAMVRDGMVVRRQSGRPDPASDAAA